MNRVVWLTGLPCSGKTTLAQALKRDLEPMYTCMILDGDDLRTGLCSDLTFSPEDRQENIRRVAEVARLATPLGIIPIVACVSPSADDRAAARAICQPYQFFEIHVSTHIHVCEERDVKGMYAQAYRGEISNFTGVHQLYEQPTSPELKIDTHHLSVAECVEKIRRTILP